jgi:hypothetical protein
VLRVRVCTYTNTRRARSRAGLFSLLCALMAPVVLSANANAMVTATTFAPTADAYVVQNKASTNFGTESKLKVQGAPIQRGYLRFDVTGLSGTIVRATLVIRAASASTVPVAVRAVSDSTWGEKTITYTNAPAPALTPTTASDAFSAGAWVTFDVTPLVGGNGTISLALTTSTKPQSTVFPGRRRLVRGSWPDRVGPGRSEADVAHVAGVGGVDCGPGTP